VESNAKDPLRKHGHVPIKCVLLKLLEGIQTGLPGLSVVSRVVVELNSAADHALIHILQTMGQNAGGLQTKQEHAPLSTVTL